MKATRNSTPYLCFCFVLALALTCRTAHANLVLVMDSNLVHVPAGSTDPFAGPTPTHFSASFFDIFTEVDLITTPPAGGLFEVHAIPAGLRRLPLDPPFPEIPIELVALQLKSLQPITVTVSGPSDQWNVIDLFVSHQGSSPGTKGADLLNDDFRIDSFFDVFVELTIEPVGGGAPQTITRQGTYPIQVHVPDSGPSLMLVMLGVGALVALRRGIRPAAAHTLS